MTDYIDIEQTDEKVEPEAQSAERRPSRRRVRSPHPGVVIRRRKVKKGYLYSARYVDPDSGKVIERVIDRFLYPNDETRKAYVIRVAQALHRRREELRSGLPVERRTTLADAFDRYFAYCEAIPLRTPTLIKYKYATRIFKSWLKRSKMECVEEIRKGTLKGFHDHLVARRKLTHRRDKVTGEYTVTDASLTPETIGGIIRPVKAMLRFWREHEWLRLSTDDIQSALKAPEVPRRIPKYLAPEDCRKLLDAALRHDLETAVGNEEEGVNLRKIGVVLPKYSPIAPLVLFFLLSGCRRKEVLNLRWDQVKLDALDAEGRRIGEILFTETQTKTKRWRTIGLEVCPSLRNLLSAMFLRAGEEDEYVFGGLNPLPSTMIEMPRWRLINKYGARQFNWQNVRQTTGTFLTNAPGIYGSASVYMSARQLGHSVAIAEKHYLGVVRGIPRDARTLEAAMQIEDLAKKIIEAVSSRIKSRELFRFGRSPKFASRMIVDAAV